MHAVDDRFIARRFVATYEQQGPLAAGQELRTTLSSQGMSPEEILVWAEENKHLVHKEFLSAGWGISEHESEVLDMDGWTD